MLVDKVGFVDMLIASKDKETGLPKRILHTEVCVNCDSSFATMYESMFNYPNMPVIEYIHYNGCMVCLHKQINEDIERALDEQFKSD